MKKISHKINQFFWRLGEGIIIAICGFIGIAGCMFAFLLSIVLTFLPVVIIMGGICWCVWFIFR